MNDERQKASGGRKSPDGSLLRVESRESRVENPSFPGSRLGTHCPRGSASQALPNDQNARHCQKREGDAPAEPGITIVYCGSAGASPSPFSFPRPPRSRSLALPVLVPSPFPCSFPRSQAPAWERERRRIRPGALSVCAEGARCSDWSATLCQISTYEEKVLSAAKKVVDFRADFWFNQWRCYAPRPPAKIPLASDGASPT